jgi:glycosyltransferase involved in cell wall biosynthesis
MEFAPVNTTGNFRSLKFVKYFREAGIEPIIVTLKETEAAQYFNAPIDNELMREIPADISIYRIHCDDGGRYFSSRLRSFITIYFSIKDSIAARWRKHLMPELDKIVSRHSPALILTTLPPFSAGMLAVEAARRYKLPLVADMRDLFGRWGNSAFGSIVHYWLTLREERKIFSHSDAIVGVTPQLLDVFRSCHPDLRPQKFHLIPNGHDQSEFQTEFHFQPARKKVVIGYVGSFYYYPERREELFKPWWRRKGHKMLAYSPVREDWRYRSPYFFFKTIGLLFKNEPQLKDVISIEFVGHVPEWLRSMAMEFGLESNLVLHGFVPHTRSKALQAGFDLLLTTSEKVPNGEHYSLPSKIFDYVGLNKPIVAFVTDGIQKEFIARSGLGIVCDPDNTMESCSKLKDLLVLGKVFEVNRDYVESFHRRKLTAKLAAIIKDLARLRC